VAVSVEVQGLTYDVHQKVLNLVQSRGLSGEETLNVGQLADRFGVSRTPISMALMRLESEGLIRRCPTKGWVTVPLTMTDIEEIFELKDALEPLTMRRAAERMDAANGARLAEAMAKLRESSAANDLDGWLSADHEFHEVLHGVVGNGRLRQFQEQLNYHLYRLTVGHVSMKGQMAMATEEHCAIGEAILANDPELAVGKASEHTRNLRDRMVGVVTEVLIPFLGQNL
jgi:DNA-binding GntR family transcriptional regulator